MPISDAQLTQDMIQTVAFALGEDLGDGDITAELIPAEQTMEARVITREDCVIAGQAWVNEVFEQLTQKTNLETNIQWHVRDGDAAKANSPLFELSGNARNLLTGERTALNFLQTLSGTATICDKYASLVEHTQVKLLDTRKTIPGLRTAQKYAVTCGSCHNHRIGLYDAFLIKENHIAACGGIEQAIDTARLNHPKKPVEIEVESLNEFKLALQASADIIMLDNFSLDEMIEAVEVNQRRSKLEASGNITNKTIVPIAETGVDYISIGALTKNCEAVDLSMRIKK